MSEPVTAPPKPEVWVEIPPEAETQIDPPYRVLIHNDDRTNPYRHVVFSAWLPLPLPQRRGRPGTLADSLFASANVPLGAR
jgi:hypothetical protein